MADLVVQLLTVEDCPHLEQAQHDLESILRTGIIEVPIQLIFVTGPDDAEFLGFQGSPTIRINGDDVVPQPELPVALACRVYRDADGRTLAPLLATIHPHPTLSEAVKIAARDG